MNKISAMLGCLVLVFVLAFWGCEQQDERISSQPLTPAGGQELESKTQEEVLHEVWQGGAYEEPFPDFLGDQPATRTADKPQRVAFPESMVGVWGKTLTTSL